MSDIVIVADQLTYKPEQAAAKLGISVSQLNEFRNWGWVECIKVDTAAKRKGTAPRTGRDVPRNCLTLYTHGALEALRDRLIAEGRGEQ